MNKKPTTFILFDEQQVVREYARRGLANTNNQNLPRFTKPQPREPMKGWECTLCEYVMTLSQCPKGECPKCKTVELTPIFGDQSFNEHIQKRKQIMRQLRTIAGGGNYVN